MRNRVIASASLLVTFILIALSGSLAGTQRDDDKPAQHRATSARSETQPAGARRIDSHQPPSQPKDDGPMTQQTQHKHTNGLIHATSPYLLQHAHNPVDWHEWGPDALQKSKAEDKPIFLSIGYAACHWCHVMERESFENEAIAAIMNEHYICIKVDREQRPDLDDIYMKATQAMTGSGGWPMSVWLTPDLKPFYAGTYFPPDNRYGRPGFPDVLLYLAEIWRDERDKAHQQADALTQAVARLSTTSPGTAVPSYDRVLQAAEQLARAFDPIKGGISGGGTNKFPPSMAMDLMLRAYHHSISDADGAKGAKKELLDLVQLTLQRMAHGGIYDQLGGGIARYSTDVDWLVPHFEKMLYDQGLVSGIYLSAYQLTHEPLYAETARGILDYVIADLQSPEGGYYSTRDADSEGEEGKFYVWTKDEIVSILGEADASLFCDYYDVSEAGNWEGRNILHVPRPPATVAKLHKLSVEELRSKLAVARKKVFAAREQRAKPGLDDKVLASWNGLMIASMARGARIFGDKRYADSAARAADFVLSKMVADGRLLRSYRDGKAQIGGYLDDHAFMIEGLLTLYETTFDVKWLKHAQQLNSLVEKHFRDDGDGGFFFTADDAERLLVRAKDAGDGAIPSGNSVQVMNLLRLSVLLGRDDLAKEAERSFVAFATQMNEMPYRSERLLAALDFYHRRPRELAIVAGGDHDGFERLVEAAWGVYLPNAVMAAIPPGADAESLGRTIPLLVGKKPVGGKSAGYVCRDFACRSPTSDVAEFTRQLGG